MVRGNNMNNKKIREIFAHFGLECTPQQIAEMTEFECLRENFLQIKPDIEELKNEVSSGQITFDDFVKELGDRYNTTCTKNQCRGLLLLYGFFMMENKH